MTNLIFLFIATVLVNNFVLTKFLGICPFLGVSNKLDSAISMGIAVTFVLVLTAAVSWVIQYYILAPFKIEFLQTILFIIVIAALVQFVEIVIKKTSEGLYLALGIYLPLITTNCCVLGLAERSSSKESLPVLGSKVALNKRPSLNGFSGRLFSVCSSKSI